MRRASCFPLLFAFLLGCHQEQKAFCQSDEDCEPGSRCATEEGLKVCRPLEGEGGSGGSGGTGGSGGAGGSGGSGGGAGHEVEIELQLEPDAKLTALLEENVRRIGRISIEQAGSEEPITLTLPEPLALPASIEFRLALPAKTGALDGKVRVEAYRRDLTLAVFAEGTISAELVKGLRLEKGVKLGLMPNFDWDRDGDPDGWDCAPEDPARHRGVVEICDGIPQGCSSHCLLPLAPGEEVRDLACSRSLRACATLVESEEEKLVRVHHGSAPWLTTVVELPEAPKGIAWDDFEGNLAIAADLSLRFARPDGSLYSGFLKANRPKRIMVSPAGAFAVSFGELGGDIYFALDPARVFSGKDAHWCNEGYCKVGSLPASIQTIHLGRGVLIHNSAADRAFVYATVPDKPYLAFVPFKASDHTRLPAGAGPVEVFDGTVLPRRLALSGEGVVVVGGESAEDAVAAWLRTDTSWDAHALAEPLELPHGSCPEEVHRHPEKELLLMTDPCTGSLWELPVDSWGKPTGEDFVQRPLAGCERPGAFTVLPATEAEEEAILVACEGESHIFVLGRY